MSVHLIEVTYSQKGGEVRQTIQEGRPGGGVRLLAETAASPMSEGIQRSAAEGATGNALFTDKGGPVIAGAHLHLIFWGKAWSDNPSPPVSAVVDAVNSTLMGPYMTGLVQYRHVGLASLGGTELATTSDPPNPFSDGDIENLISGLVAQGSLPNPATDDQLLFLVVLPTGVRSAGPFDGEHSFFTSAGVNVHYGWITHDGQLESLTTIFSHELVESVTDPEGTAIVGVEGTCSQPGWCEIGDICENSTGTVNGVTVQAYWSDLDHACIIPGS